MESSCPIPISIRANSDSLDMALGLLFVQSRMEQAAISGRNRKPRIKSCFDISLFGRVRPIYASRLLQLDRGWSQDIFHVFLEILSPGAEVGLGKPLSYFWC